jgi:hypothetical protein
MDRWPCFDCRHFDTFDSNEEDELTCKIGRTLTHLNCEFREPYSIEACNFNQQGG